MKSTVFAILALSSAKVSSVSSCLGTSTPARRATAPLAVSQAICTWRFIGNMFGKRRQLVNTVGSILFASACAWANKIEPTVLTNCRSEEHTSELQSLTNLVCRLLLEKKKKPAHI